MINDAHTGTLSSYSYVMLLFHWLQRDETVAGVVLPDLQSKELFPELQEERIDVYDVSFKV